MAPAGLSISYPKINARSPNKPLGSFLGGTMSTLINALKVDRG